MVSNRYIFVSLLRVQLLFLGSCAGVAATLPESGPIVPELQAFADAMTNFMSPRNLNAGTIAVMKDDLLILRQGFGYQDKAKTTTIHPDAIMRLASISKPLTGSAITKLVNDGKLTYNTKMYSLLGVEPFGGVIGDSRLTNITVQHLLDHTAGWDRNIGPVYDPVFSTVLVSQQMGLDHPANSTDLIRWMFAKPLQHAPGTSNVYSNFGYDVLGRIIEKVSGQSYLSYLQDNVLGPAGITNIIQTRSRPEDRDPREIWYADSSSQRSAVDYPTNKTVSFVDGGGYYESYDSFAGMAASAVELCRYTQRFFVSDSRRPTTGSWFWNYIFYGSLPGTTTAIHQDLKLTSNSTNAFAFAVLFNKRTENTSVDENDLIHTMIMDATNSVTSWPTANGGRIQWGLNSAYAIRSGGGITIPLTRTGGSPRAAKISFTTYSISANTNDYVPQSGIVSFAQGDTQKTVTIPIVNGIDSDTPKQFKLEIISASGGASIGTPFTATVTIISPPRIALLGKSVDGHFNFNIISASGVPLRIENSMDFVTWQSLATVTNTTGLLNWTDSQAASLSRQFYRLVVLP